jgi:hypothetical protein
LLWTATLLRGRLAAPVSPNAAGEPTSVQRLLAGCSLAVVVIAVAVAAGGGLASNARRAARDAAFAGDTQRALALAERATSLAPWDVDAALLHARMAVDVALGERADEAAGRRAADRVERVVRLAPTRASARELRARVRSAAGDAPGALADLSTAARLHPAHGAYAAARDRWRERLAAETAEPAP